MVTAVLANGLVTGKADAATTNFKDVTKNHWAYSAITQVASKNLVSGYADGTYRPSNNVTRAEFATFLSRSFDGEERTSEPFVDIASNHWAVDAIEEGIALGFIKPNEYANSKFEPNKAMTRAEMARWLANGLVAGNSDYGNAISEMANSNLTLIPIPEFYKGGVNKSDLPYIGVAMGTGLLSGYNDYTFKPNGKTIRAEVAVILLRYLEAMKKAPSAYSELEELREVARTGTNMTTVTGMTADNENRDFTALRNEPYTLKSGIGKTSINRMIFIDTRDYKNVKGIYRNMFSQENAKDVLTTSKNRGVYFYATEHKYIPSKVTPNASTYIQEANKPEFFFTSNDGMKSATTFGFSDGAYYFRDKWDDKLGKVVNAWNPTIGKEITMWFSGIRGPYGSSKNTYSMNGTWNDKLFSFGKLGDY